MTEEQEADQQTGKALSRMAGDRHDATKDLYFERDPATAALRYPFDPRSVEVLGVAEWNRLHGDDED